MIYLSMILFTLGIALAWAFYGRPNSVSEIYYQLKKAGVKAPQVVFALYFLAFLLPIFFLSIHWTVNLAMLLILLVPAAAQYQVDEVSKWHTIFAIGGYVVALIYIVFGLGAPYIALAYLGAAFVIEKAVKDGSKTLYIEALGYYTILFCLLLL